jgi:hypothetical protein
MSTWQKRLHADVDLQAALDAADDGALDDLVALARSRDLVPDAHLVGLLFREDDHAGVVLTALEQHFHGVAGLEGGLALGVGELADGNLSF